MFRAMRLHPMGQWVLTLALALALYAAMLSVEIARTPKLRSGVSQLASSWYDEQVKCLALEIKTLGAAEHCGRDE